MASSPKPASSTRQSIVGQALMLVAALFWGSNPAALRYLYTSPGPPAPSFLAAIELAVAALILVWLCALKQLAEHARRRPLQAVQPSPEDAERLLHQAVPQATIELGAVSRAAKPGWVLPVKASLPREPAVPELALPAEPNRPQRTPSGAPTAAGLAVDSPSGSGMRLGLGWVRAAGRVVQAALTHQTPSLATAGTEVGLLSFVAYFAYVLGFSFTTASRGAFLLRSSIVGTPILSTLAGEKVPRVLWASAVLGFVGCALIGADPAPGEGKPADGPAAADLVWLGDAVLLGAAAALSLVMVRQSYHAPRFLPLELTAAKLVVMAFAASLWLAGDLALLLARGMPVAAAWPGWRSGVGWAVVLWPAVGPWSTAEVAQFMAQARISASHAQVILAVDPLLSVGFAGFVGSDEQRLGPLGWAGGGLLVLACLIASVAARPEV